MRMERVWGRVWLSPQCLGSLKDQPSETVLKETTCGMRGRGADVTGRALCSEVSRLFGAPESLSLVTFGQWHFSPSYQGGYWGGGVPGLHKAKGRKKGPAEAGGPGGRQRPQVTLA